MHNHSVVDPLALMESRMFWQRDQRHRRYRCDGDYLRSIDNYHNNFFNQKYIAITMPACVARFKLIAYLINLQMTDVTRILSEIENGCAESAEVLLTAVYDQLRAMAAVKMSQERPGQTLDATALVHEAYLRLAGNQTFQSRRHFFGAAAEAMRRILIERARARNAEKRGGGVARADFDVNQLQQSGLACDRLDALNAALHQFEQIDPEKAELVKLRYFAGLKIREAAQILGISTATADRHWVYARAWLQSRLNDVE